MPFSKIIQSLLTQQQIPFTVVGWSTSLTATDAGIPSNAMAAIGFLKDPKGILMAIYPNRYHLDINLLKAVTNRAELRFMSIEELDETMKCLEKQGQPSLCAQNGIQLIIDELISNKDDVYFVTGNPHQMIRADIWDIQLLVEDALIGGKLSRPNHNLDESINQTIGAVSLRDKLEKLDDLPVMPTMATQLLQLKNNPESTVDDLVQIISKDPVLTAQILGYANSALFGFSGQITTLQDAIFRVLGYETVLYMAFGASLGRSFTLPTDGRIGMNNFWKQATYRAALCQQLAQRMPPHFRAPPSVAYITGLLHNLGLIMMGTMFPSEFAWLNKMLSSRPEQSLLMTEKNLFGITHPEVGRFVLQQWQLPSEITTVVGEHHNASYQGIHAIYVWLVQLAGQALRPYDLSDSEEAVISVELCKHLELEESAVLTALETVMDEKSALESMVNTLCA